MPMYEYQCSDCNKVHEIIQKFSDPLLTECPECKGPLSKLISMNSFSLKGVGWYTTDYKRAGAKPEASESPPVAAAAPAAAVPAGTSTTVAPAVAAPVAAPVAAAPAASAPKTGG